MKKLKNIWKSQTAEDRRKIIAYSIVGFLGFGMLFSIYLFKTSGDNAKVEALSNPDAKAGKNYNSRLEANQMDRKDSVNINTDEAFGISNNASFLFKEKTEEQTEVYYEPNYTSAGSGSSQTSGSYRSSYPQDETPVFKQEKQSFSERPSEIRREDPLQIEKSPEPSQNKISNEIFAGNVQVQESEHEKPTKTLQIKARLLSQGYVSSGKTITFVLLDNPEINGNKTPKGQTVSGVAFEQNNRLMVKFSTIKVNGNIIPVTMQLYGSDGIEGLPISGFDQDNLNNASSSIINSTVGNIPIVGRMASDALQNSNKKSMIKLTPNTSCIITYTS